MAIDERVSAVRAFNRFYTRRIGVLAEHLHDSPFSLAELRVLYELANSDQPTAGAIGGTLGIDPGYLSRILGRFEARGYVERHASAIDKRSRSLKLTRSGRDVYSRYNECSRDEMAVILGNLSTSEQDRLVNSLAVVRRLLEGAHSGGPSDYLVRAHRPGDIGWVVQRHGALYADEYGWTVQFEAMVAEIAAKFVQNFDPARERCWIAERGGENIGCIFLVRSSDEVAQLRLFLVEPSARGLGVGRRLLDECISFARQAEYAKLTLWTNALLTSACHLYERAGFCLVDEELVHDLGMEFTAQTWDLNLGRPNPASPGDC